MDDEYMVEWGKEHPCPKCGGPTYFESDCPGYNSRMRLKDGSEKPSVMVCYPACGNAMYYGCSDLKSCGWWWREPNRRNTKPWNGVMRDYVEMGPAPDWLNKESVDRYEESDF